MSSEQSQVHWSKDPDMQIDSTQASSSGDTHMDDVDGNPYCDAHGGTSAAAQQTCPSVSLQGNVMLIRQCGASRA